MNPNRLLETIQIASPCQASWGEMRGDDRARFCSQCSKCVYNIAMMPALDVAKLIEETEGRVCMRLYRRRDGTVLTADCPVGAEQAKRGRLRRVVAWSVLGLSVLFTRSLLQSYAASAERPQGAGGGLSQRLEACVDWAKDIIGLNPTPTGTVTMGVICPPSNSSIMGEVDLTSLLDGDSGSD